VETNLVRSVVLLHYVPDDDEADPLYWLWTDDRKVLMDGSFHLPSVDPEAFKSECGFPISTWSGKGGIMLPRVENDRSDEESLEESSESDDKSDGSIDNI
jgi:hypothetical protein